MCYRVLSDDLYIGILFKQILGSVLYPSGQSSLLFAGCFSVLRVLLACVYKDGLLWIVFA